MAQFKKTHDLCVKVRSYKDKDGNDKNFYENIGSIMQGDDGRSFLLLKRYINIAGFPCKENSDSITVSMFSSQRQNNFSYQPQQQNFNYQGENFNEHINNVDAQMMNFDDIDNPNIPF